jgi:hypothetical protein
MDPLSNRSWEVLHKRAAAMMVTISPAEIWSKRLGRTGCTEPHSDSPDGPRAWKAMPRRNPMGNLRNVRIEVPHKHSPVRRQRSERIPAYASVVYLQQNAFMLSDTILVGTRCQNDLGVGVVNVRFSKIYHSIYASTNFPKWHETPHFVKLCSCAGNACQVEQRQCSLFKKQVLRDNAT